MHASGVKYLFPVFRCCYQANKEKLFHTFTGRQSEQERLFEACFLTRAGISTKSGIPYYRRPLSKLESLGHISRGFRSSIRDGEMGKPITEHGFAYSIRTGTTLRSTDLTNQDIIAQILSTSIAGDIVMAAAYSHELPRYGLEVGLTNYAAAYCMGLLLARRVLKMLDMDNEYERNMEATGEDYSVEPTDSRRPFRALLDVGLIRTTTGNRVFGSLKIQLEEANLRSEEGARFIERLNALNAAAGHEDDDDK